MCVRVCGCEFVCVGCGTLGLVRCASEGVEACNERAQVSTTRRRRSSSGSPPTCECTHTHTYRHQHVGANDGSLSNTHTYAYPHTHIGSVNNAPLAAMMGLVACDVIVLPSAAAPGAPPLATLRLLVRRESLRRSADDVFTCSLPLPVAEFSRSITRGD